MLLFSRRLIVFGIRPKNTNFHFNCPQINLFSGTGSGGGRERGLGRAIHRDFGKKEVDFKLIFGGQIDRTSLLLKLKWSRGTKRMIEKFNYLCLTFKCLIRTFDELGRRLIKGNLDHTQKSNKHTKLPIHSIVLSICGIGKGTGRTRRRKEFSTSWWSLGPLQSLSLMNFNSAIIAFELLLISQPRPSQDRKQIRMSGDDY